MVGEVGWLEGWSDGSQSLNLLGGGGVNLITVTPCQVKSLPWSNELPSPGCLLVIGRHAPLWQGGDVKLAKRYNRGGKTDEATTKIGRDTLT